MLSKVITVYSIENNIVSNKEIFDYTNIVGSKITMVQCDEFIKGISEYSNKCFSIFPYMGKNSLGFLIHDVDIV